MNHGLILKEYLEINSVKPQVLGKYLGKSSKTVYSWFKKETLNYDTIMLLVSNTMLTFSSFGVETPVNPFTIKKIRDLTQISLFPTKNTENIEKAFNEYFGLLENTVLKTNKEFIVYDYLAKMQNETLQKEGKDVHKRFSKYLKNIDLHLNEKKVNYSRILTLPLSNIDISKEESIHAAFNYLFIENFEHIWLSFRNPNFRLFILSRPIKLHSFAIVDEEYGITEYERYDFNGGATPELLIINQIDYQNPSYGTDILKRYISITKELINEGAINAGPIWSIGHQEIDNTLRERYLELIEAMAKLKGDIKAFSDIIKKKFDNINKDDVNKSEMKVIRDRVEDKKKYEKELHHFEVEFKSITEKIRFIDENKIL